MKKYVQSLESRRLSKSRMSESEEEFVVYSKGGGGSDDEEYATAPNKKRKRVVLAPAKVAAGGKVNLGRFQLLHAHVYIRMHVSVDGCACWMLFGTGSLSYTLDFPFTDFIHYMLLFDSVYISYFIWNLIIFIGKRMQALELPALITAVVAFLKEKNLESEFAATLPATDIDGFIAKLQNVRYYICVILHIIFLYRA